MTENTLHWRVNGTGGNPVGRTIAVGSAESRRINMERENKWQIES